jgi:hypothetical protein
MAAIETGSRCKNRDLSRRLPSDSSVNPGDSTQARRWHWPRRIMGLMFVTVTLRVPGTQSAGYEGLFLVDSGAIDSMAPASALAAAGFDPVGNVCLRTRRRDRARVSVRSGADRVHG